MLIVNPAGVSVGLYPGVTISGVVGYNYIIQETTDLSNPNSWVTLTNLTLQQPVQLWVDTNVERVPSQKCLSVLPGPAWSVKRRRIIKPRGLMSVSFRIPRWPLGPWAG